MLAAGLDRRRVGAGVGFGQREGHDQLTGRDARKELLLLRLGAVHQDALRPDADIGAEYRTEGQRGVAELEGSPALLAHRQPDAAIFLRDRQAEQTHLLHVLDDVGGYLVVLLHRIFRRHEAFAHETLHGREEQLK